MPDEQDILKLTVREFLDATASKASTPGGGSVAGLAGALGTALGEMALRFSEGKKSFTEHRETHERISARLGRARAMFAQLITEDMRAFQLFQQAQAMDAGPDKDEQTQLALAAAIDVPRQTAKIALAVLDDLAVLVDKTARWLVSDLLAGAELAEATVAICDLNVRINTRSLDDAAAAAEIADASAQDLAAAREKLDAMRQAGTARING